MNPAKFKMPFLYSFSSSQTKVATWKIARVWMYNGTLFVTQKGIFFPESCSLNYMKELMYGIFPIIMEYLRTH